MIHLGVADGRLPAAAVAVDGHIVGAATGRDASGVPWDAIEAAMLRAGVGPGDIDAVAVAGRFTHVAMRQGLGGSWSDSAGAVAQTLLRATGLGAVQADQTAERWERDLAGRGVRPHRVTFFDGLGSLAEASYRTCPFDDVAILVVEPLVDGLVAGVFHGVSGQVDRVAAYGPRSTFASVDRQLTAAFGAPLGAGARLDGPATDADDDLVPALVRSFSREGWSSGWQALAAAPAQVAGPSAREALAEWLVEHVSTVLPGLSLAVAGRWFGDAGLVDAMASRRPGLHVGPAGGPARAAIGAALRAAGASPDVRSAAEWADLVSGRAAAGVQPGPGPNP